MTKGMIYFLVILGFAVGAMAVWFLYPAIHPCPVVRQIVVIDTGSVQWKHDTIPFPVTVMDSIAVHDTILGAPQIVYIPRFTMDTTFASPVIFALHSRT